MFFFFLFFFLENVNVTSNEKCVPLPLVKNWTTNMGLVPEKFHTQLWWNTSSRDS